MRSPGAIPAALLTAVLVPCALAAGTALPASGWLQAIPRAGRASLLTATRKLLSAEAQQDWPAVYRLRPILDRETETQEQFVRRWHEVTPVKVLDFEPLRASESLFAAVSNSERVFEVMGCTRVERDGKTAGQEGSISAHWEDGIWYLDGVHLLTTDEDEPEPCDFHAAHGVLGAGPRGR